MTKNRDTDIKNSKFTRLRMDTLNIQKNDRVIVAADVRRRVYETKNNRLILIVHKCFPAVKGEQTITCADIPRCILFYV